MFKYYVMNETFNKKRIEPFNIFDNWPLDEAVQREVKKYLRAPKNYKKITQYGNPITGREEIAIYGFDAFCEELRSLIAWQLHFRCEYEVVVGSMFDKDGKTFRKIDCYMQCEKNIPMIAREVIYQWKHRKDNNED